MGTPVRSKVGRDGEQRFSCAWLNSGARVRDLRRHTLAWHENREAQLAPTPLPLLSIPGRISCWPGQIRWILGSTSAPGLKPRSPSRASGVATLLGLFVPHSTGTAIWHLGLCCQWWGWLRPGHLRAGSWGGCGHFGGSAAGRDEHDHPGGETTPAGVWDGNRAILHWGGKGKVKAKRSL